MRVLIVSLLTFQFTAKSSDLISFPIATSNSTIERFIFDRSWLSRQNFDAVPNVSVGQYDEHLEPIDKYLIRFCYSKGVQFNDCMVLFQRVLNEQTDIDQQTQFNLWSQEQLSKFVAAYETKNFASYSSERFNMFRAALAVQYYNLDRKIIGKDVYTDEDMFDDRIWTLYLQKIGSKLIPHQQRTLERNGRICFIHSCRLPSRLNGTLSNINDPPPISSVFYYLDALADAGLLNEIDFVCVLNYGDPIQMSELSETQVSRYFSVSSNVVFLQRSSDVTHYEIPTLRHLHSFTRNLHRRLNESVDTIDPRLFSELYATQVLYLHTKGVSYRAVSPAIQDWVEYMMYFLVTLHRSCMRLLNSGFIDVVGVEHSLIPKRHFSGNFWWTNSAYLAHSLRDTLPRYASKYDAEFWVLSQFEKSGRYRTMELWRSAVNFHYWERTHPETYRKPSLSSEMPETVHGAFKASMDRLKPVSYNTYNVTEPISYCLSYTASVRPPTIPRK
jgi:hypothetical protein